MARVRPKAIMASSRPITAYGGIQLPEHVIRELAEATARGEMPMSIGHDAARPLATYNVSAGVQRSDDGYLQAWAEFDVEEGAWNCYQEELRAAGIDGLGGMSITFMTPLDGEEWLDDATAVVSGDAHHFTDDEIRSAAAILQEHDDAAVGQRLYQLSATPLLTIVFDITTNFVGALGPNLAASVIYDAAKVLFRRGQRNNIDIAFKEARRGRRSLKISIKAESDDELKTAMDRLPAVLESGAKGVFSHQATGFVRVDEEMPAAVETEPLELQEGIEDL